MLSVMPAANMHVNSYDRDVSHTGNTHTGNNRQTDRQTEHRGTKEVNPGQAVGQSNDR